MQGSRPGRAKAGGGIPYIYISSSSSSFIIHRAAAAWMILSAATGYMIWIMADDHTRAMAALPRPYDASMSMRLGARHQQMNT